VQRQPSAADAQRDPRWWHLGLILLVSAGFEWNFLHSGVSWFDEGWPLYAAKRLHEGGTLYRDIFFLFPPGHLFPAWIAYAIDPPGVVLARSIYSLFNVALCLGFYELGRRFMPALFALSAALLLALAASHSHYLHLLFGYRYLVFSVLALLAFDRRLRGGDPRWMLAAGAWTGIALIFRQSPAFAVACGIGVALIAQHESWQERFADGLRYSAGLLAAVLPALAWFAWSVGLDTLWQETVLRLMGLQHLQSTPFPPLEIPAQWDRGAIYRAFVALQFPLYAALYTAYGVALAWRWFVRRRRGQPFDAALPLAIAVWGAVFLIRTIGRSDDHHLNSALPPVCLLLAHALWRGLRRLGRSGEDTRRRRIAWGLACAGMLAGWVFLGQADRFLGRELDAYATPLESLGGRVRVRSAGWLQRMDREVAWIRSQTSEGDTILDLSASPLLYVVADRSGPGYFDIVMPGTFLDAEEQQEFVRHLESAPPALVVWPREPFDRMPSRGVAATAPTLVAWIRGHYAPLRTSERYLYLAPRPR
jgi:hypothetical protein